MIHQKRTVQPENLQRAFERMGGIGKHGEQLQIAHKLGVTTQAVSRWLNPNIDSQPTVDKLIRISEASGMSLDEIILGEGHARNSFNTAPVLDDYTQAVALLKKQGIGKKQHIPVLGNLKHAFAVRCEDESMQRESGRSFEKGSLLVFDTQAAQPKHEDFVFAILENNGVFSGVFRRLININNKQRLIALNTAYPTIKDFEIAATLAYAILD